MAKCLSCGCWDADPDWGQCYECWLDDRQEDDHYKQLEEKRYEDAMNKLREEEYYAALSKAGDNSCQKKPSKTKSLKK